MRVFFFPRSSIAGRIKVATMQRRFRKRFWRDTQGDNKHLKEQSVEIKRSECVCVEAVECRMVFCECFLCENGKS